MYRFRDFVDRVEGMKINEASNISSALVLRKQNEVLRYGRNVLKSTSIEDKLDLLAKQNVALSGLVLMSVAISGNKSFMSSIVKGFSR